MCGALVHGKGRRLTVVLAAVLTLVWLHLRVHDVVLVQRRILREPLAATLHLAHVRLLTCPPSHDSTVHY